MISVNIIGASRLGQHWLAALSQLDSVHVQTIVSRHLGEDATPYPVTRSIKMLAPADLTFICVNDDALAPIIDKLAKYYDRHSKQTFVHCAGRYSSDLLKPLAKLGAYIASVHPLKAFTRHICANAFKDCPISIEGDSQSMAMLEPLLQQLQAKLFRIDKQHKALYHSACALASNGLVGLAHATSSIFTSCGIQPELAKKLALSLMSASLENCQNNALLIDALTGPIARNDKETVKAHLEALNSDSGIQDLYTKLSEQILSLISKGETFSEWLEK